MVQSDNYRLTKHILPTTNIVELLMFLRTNRSLWNAEAVEAAIAASNA